MSAERFCARASTRENAGNKKAPATHRGIAVIRFRFQWRRELLACRRAVPRDANYDGNPHTRGTSMMHEDARVHRGDLIVSPMRESPSRGTTIESSTAAR